MNTKNDGLLISIEGIDGSGKSSLSQGLAQKCKNLGYPVLLTKEPGGTPFGMQLRPLLNYQTEPLDPKTEFLCFAADRAQHFSYVILPALKERKIVISDRMADSSLVYQGYGRGLDKEMINLVNNWAMQNHKPDFVFYLKITADEALKRIANRNTEITSFEKEYSFIKTISEGFDTAFTHRKEVITFDATKEPSILIEEAFTIIQDYYKKHLS
ncbi:dTMP kinase [bacterium]|nr:dTMP kinase [bacterium]